MRQGTIDSRPPRLETHPDIHGPGSAQLLLKERAEDSSGCCSQCPLGITTVNI